MNFSTLHIGIDPGKYGSICLNYKGDIRIHNIPLIGKEYDTRGLAKLFEEIYELSQMVLFTHCVVEDVHAVFGAAAGATFEFGYGVGLIEGMLAIKHIPFTKVAPKKWQKEMFEGVPEIKKPSTTGKTMKTDTKKMAEIAAKRLFPGIDFTNGGKSVKVNDGKVDATLMCEYCKRNF